MLRHYGSALRYGNKYIYQCMPRLLSLWLDFGAKVTEEEGNIIKSTINEQGASYCFYFIEKKPRESSQIKSTLTFLNNVSLILLFQYALMFCYLPDDVGVDRSVATLPVSGSIFTTGI